MEHARRQHHPLIREMLKDRAFGKALRSFKPNPEDQTYDRLLQQFGIREPATESWRKWIRKFGRVIETFTVFQETWGKTAAFQIATDRGFSPRERAAIVRNYSGTPDSAQRGLASDAVNGVVLYANVIMSGLRTDAQVALQPQTAAGFWFRSLLVDFLPKMVMAAAVLGWFDGEGDDEAEESVSAWFRRIPSYDLEKYIIVPAPPFWSVNEEGEKRAVYLRLPHEDVNRIFAGAAWALLMNEAPRPVARSLGLVSGEFGGLNPGLTMLSAYAQVGVMNRNPIDTFRGRPIVPQTEWDAGGWQRWKSTIRWSMGEFGIASDALRFLTTTLDPDATPGEMLTGVPGLSALVKISDRGLEEPRDWEVERQDQQRAKLRADLSRDARRLLGERARLNRAGLERLNARERGRRREINAWYRDYLRFMDAMESAREAGDTGSYERAKAELNRRSAAVSGR
jgi:hypothetical protein